MKSLEKIDQFFQQFKGEVYTKTIFMDLKIW